jgi:Zn-dependent M28 family amino/carboxypeptidase
MILTAINVNAQKEGLLNINESDLRSSMQFFASDEMRGRETGTKENDIAALYLKTSIMRLGLKPIPSTGDYLQSLPLVSSEIKSIETYLKISDNNDSTLFSTDSLIYLMSESTTTEIAGGFVFAGFGYSDSVSGYDDFKGLNLKDKIVMIMTGKPGEKSPDEVNPVFDSYLEGPKIMTAFREGARAILCVYEPGNKFTDAYKSGLADMGVPRVGSKTFSLAGRETFAPVQVAFITRYAADQLLKTSGYNLQSAYDKIVSENKPSSVELTNTKVTFRTFIQRRNIVSNNVIGIVEGSDPVLKNECIIYTAHFDHIGVNGDGESFDGADDNASGSMALLEVAQAFQNLKKKPLRTVLFAWVNGEEKGLLGSDYYTENPVFPLEKTLLNINLDMVGRSKMPSDTGKFMGYDISVSQPGEILMYTDQRGNEILDIIKTASKSAGIKTINMGRDPEIGSSDYASFMAKGVPAVFFNSGDYPDLHTPGDVVGKIDFDKMERVSDMVFLLGYKVANQKESLKQSKEN